MDTYWLSRCCFRSQRVLCSGWRLRFLPPVPMCRRLFAKAPAAPDAGGSRQRARTILAAAEIALAMVLLVGAGLLVRSFIAMTSVSPGFRSQHLVKAEVSCPASNIPRHSSGVHSPTICSREFRPSPACAIRPWRFLCRWQTASSIWDLKSKDHPRRHRRKPHGKLRRFQPGIFSSDGNSLAAGP